MEGLKPQPVPTSFGGRMADIYQSDLTFNQDLNYQVGNPDLNKSIWGHFGVCNCFSRIESILTGW